MDTGVAECQVEDGCEEETETYREDEQTQITHCNIIWDKEKLTRLNSDVWPCDPASFPGIPSHIGIPGNKPAEKGAKHALNLRIIDEHSL